MPKNSYESPRGSNRRPSSWWLLAAGVVYLLSIAAHLALFTFITVFTKLHFPDPLTAGFRILTILSLVLMTPFILALVIAIAVSLIWKLTYLDAYAVSIKWCLYLCSAGLVLIFCSFVNDVVRFWHQLQP